MGRASGPRTEATRTCSEILAPCARLSPHPWLLWPCLQGAAATIRAAPQLRQPQRSMRQPASVTETRPVRLRTRGTPGRSSTTIRRARERSTPPGASEGTARTPRSFGLMNMCRRRSSQCDCLHSRNFSPVSQGRRANGRSSIQTSLPALVGRALMRPPAPPGTSPQHRRRGSERCPATIEEVGPRSNGPGEEPPARRTRRWTRDDPRGPGTSRRAWKRSPPLRERAERGRARRS
jgi:hypothetical protein